MSAECAKIEAPRGVCAGGGVPLPRGGVPLPLEDGSGQGAVPPPQNFFLIFKIKMTCFGALWSIDYILNVPAREGS